MLSPWNVLIGAVKVPPPPMAMDEPPPKPKSKSNSVLDRVNGGNNDKRYGITAEQRKEIQRLFVEEGMTAIQIAAATGHIIHAVSYYGGEGKIRKQRKDARKARIAELMEQKFKSKEIAAIMGIARQTVSEYSQEIRGRVKSPRAETLARHRAAVLAEYVPGKVGSYAIGHKLNIPLGIVRDIIKEERARLGLN